MRQWPLLYPPLQAFVVIRKRATKVRWTHKKLWRTTGRDQVLRIFPMSVIIIQFPSCPSYHIMWTIFLWLPPLPCLHNFVIELIQLENERVHLVNTTLFWTNMFSKKIRYYHFSCTFLKISQMYLLVQVVPISTLLKDTIYTKLALMP